MTEPTPLDYMFRQNNRPVWSRRAATSPFVAIGAFLLQFAAVPFCGTRPGLAVLWVIALAMAALAYTLRACHDLYLGHGRLRGHITVAASISFTAFTGLGCNAYAYSLYYARQSSISMLIESGERDLATECRRYAVDNHDVFPPHLATLVVAKQLSLKNLVDPSSTTPPLSDGPLPPDWTALAPVVEAHCDFVYLGAGMESIPDSSLVLLYSKVKHVHFDPKSEQIDYWGRVVGFADGHTELITDADLTARIAYTNTERAHIGLSTVTPP